MNPYLSAVNQKLFFCNLLLKQGVKGEPEKSSSVQSNVQSSTQLEEALCQSALYQLEAAYGQYLREIAATYQFKSPETVSSAESLATALFSINKHPAEAQEILSLLEQKNSWLSQLLNAHKSLSSISSQLATPSASNSAVSGSNNSPIAVVEVKQLDDIDTLGYELLMNWHKAFVEMVNRHREMMVEC